MKYTPVIVACLLAVVLFSGDANSVFAQNDQPPTATPTVSQPQNQPPTATPVVNTPPTATPVVAPPGNTNPTRPALPGIPGGGGNNGGTTGQSAGSATCDVCGYCDGMTLEQVPDRWQDCRRCVYPDLGGVEADINPLENRTLRGIPQPSLYNIYTDFGCISTEPGQFAAQISSLFFSLVGSIAFLFFIYGAAMIATARSDPGRLNQGKRIVYGAIIGLLFALFAVFIIRFIATGIGLPDIGGN